MRRVRLYQNRSSWQVIFLCSGDLFCQRCWRPHPEFPHHCPRTRPDPPRQISRILCPAKKSRLRLRDIVSQGPTSVAIARSPKLWVFSAAGNCGVLRVAPFRREESLRQLFQVCFAKAFGVRTRPRLAFWEWPLVGSRHLAFVPFFVNIAWKRGA
jgi:hypothetical protein